MAKLSIANLKTKFQTGDTPTQQDFYDWLDSFEHLDFTRRGYAINSDTNAYNAGSPLTNAGLPSTDVENRSTAIVTFSDYIVTYMYNGTIWELVAAFAGGGGGGVGDMTKAVYDAAAINEQLVGLVAAQTLTNKTINAASNTISNIAITNFDTDTKDVMGFVNCEALDAIDLNVTSDGATVTASVEKLGGGDVRIVFSTGVNIWDTTPAETVSLTVGTDINPQINYIYYLESTSTFIANTTGFPTAEYLPVATIICQSAAGVQTDGPYKVHQWVDAVTNVNGQGHLSHLNSWIRSRPAGWYSGVATTPTAGIGSLVVATTSGIIKQLHDHNFPARTTPTDPVFVVNDNTVAYRRVTDPTLILTDASGVSMSNTRYNIIIWGSVNEKATDCKVFWNLPTSTYTKDQDAIDDISGFSTYDYPPNYTGTGFLIARLTIRHVSATNTWSILQNKSLLGKSPSTAPGSGSGLNLVEFPDNAFKVYNAADNTKIIEVDAGNITTATTRTITMPDNDVNLDDINIANKTIVTPVAGDYLMITDVSDGGALKKVNLADILSAGGGDDLGNHTATEVLKMGAFGIGYDNANPGIFFGTDGNVALGEYATASDVDGFVQLTIPSIGSSLGNANVPAIHIKNTTTTASSTNHCGFTIGGAGGVERVLFAELYDTTNVGKAIIATVDGTLSPRLILDKVDGAVMPDYGGGTYTGTRAKDAAWDADGKLIELPPNVQDYTNLDNHFTYVNDADSNNYGLVGFNAPENVYNIDDKTIAVAFRYNNENDPSTVLDHAAGAAVGGLVLYDITDIGKPVVLDTYKDANLIGCMSVTVHGDILYVMSSKKGRIHILDIKDRNNIVKLADFQYETSTHVSTVAYRTDIHRSGNWLFVCGRYEASAAGKVYSIDVRNPSVPVLVTTGATLGYWTYDLRSIGEKLYVTYYGSTTPSNYATYDINASTGALTNQANVAKTNANGVSNFLHGNKFVVCEWNNNVTIYDVDPETFGLTESIQTSSPDADDNRVDIMKKYDINLLAFAGYTSDRVGLQIYNEDFTVKLGTSYIDHLNFDIVQAIRFVGDYLYVLNKSGIHNIMIYKFNYNSFAKERDGFR